MKALDIHPYMYYRLATWFFKFEKKSKISFAASALVTLSQMMILTNIFGMIILENFNKVEGKNIINNHYPYYIAFTLIIAIVNDIIYRNKYDVYQEKWKDENKTDKFINGIFVTALIILPIIFIPIVLNIFDYSN